MEWLNILAVLLSPLFAVQASQWLDRKRDEKRRQVAIFQTLMTTRAQSLSPQHVQALNAIDLEFGDKKSKGVREAWKAYLDHLNTSGATPEMWAARREELFVDLMHTMSARLAYKFDKTEIRRSIYAPRGHSDLERDNEIVRKALVAIMEGKAGFPIWVANLPTDAGAQPSPAAVAAPSPTTLPSA